MLYDSMWWRIFSGYVDNLHKPDYKVVLLHVMENLMHVKDMSKLSIYDMFRKIYRPQTRITE